MERGKMGHRIRNRSNSVVVDTSALQVECLPQSVASGPMDLAFIHRLPPEILTAVLLLVAKDQMPPYWYRSTVLGSVCRRWREVLNNAKSLWNNILIFAPDQDPNGIYPGPELLDIVLQRANGSAIELLIECNFNHYEWIFRSIQKVSSEMTNLTLSIVGNNEALAELDQTILQIHLPCLEELTVYFNENWDSPEVRSFLRCSLDIAARSGRADHLRLSIGCHAHALIPILARHEAFSKAKKIVLYTGQESLLSLESLNQTFHLPNLQHLEGDLVDHLLPYLTVPRLHTLDIWYRGGGSAYQLNILKPLASQLQNLTLWIDGNPTLFEGCSAPLSKLKELYIRTIPPSGSSPSLLLTPNLESLKVMPLREKYQSIPAHCLRYMLSPNGMLGPIRALKQLHLIHIPLSDESQSDYCTAHLRYHRHLENLAIEDSNLPQDFVELMVKPLSASNALLPNLKRLDFGWYRLINPPSTDWFTALAKARPSLVVIYRGDLLFPWSKIDAFERPEH